MFSTVMSSTFKLLLLVTITSVYSFTSTGYTPTRTTSILMAGKSYAELLQASKLAKQNAGGAAPRPAAAPVARTPLPPAENVRGIVELPFDDNMYDHLKFVIGKLSARMKSDIPLTAAELQSFKNSCNEIIVDAKKTLGPQQAAVAVVAAPVVRAAPAPAARAPVVQRNQLESIPFRTVDERRRDGSDIVHKAPGMMQQTKKEEDFVIWEAGDGPTSEEAPDPSSPFADLHGLSNTWQMPGMDNMTTDEYYAAINKRILDMKAKRKQTEGGSSNTMVTDYFEQLSAGNPRRKQ